MKNLLVLISMLMLLFSCSTEEAAVVAEKPATEKSACGGCAKGCEDVEQDTECSDDVALNTASEAQITFIELGSESCVPCKQMKPVIQAIEKKYQDQVAVIFYNVMKPEQKKYAQQYKIRMIPTQIFLDKNGKELYRHEGFLPEKEIIAFLDKQGISAKAQG